MANIRTLPDLLEITQTFAQVAGGGGVATADVDIANLTLGIVRCRIFEVMGDSNSANFDIEVYEDATYTRLNRIIQVLGINTHNVTRFVEGASYQDRRAFVLPTTQGQFHLRVVNPGVLNDIVMRVKYLPFYAR